MVIRVAGPAMMGVARGNGPGAFVIARWRIAVTRQFDDVEEKENHPGRDSKICRCNAGKTKDRAQQQEADADERCKAHRLESRPAPLLGLQIIGDP